MPSIVVVLLIALPWLNPFSMGPTPAVPTLLFSWACGAFFSMGCSFSTAELRSGGLTRDVTVSWLIAALISAFFGLLQFFGYVAFFDGWVNNAALGEAYANLRQRNHFATLTSIGLATLVRWTSDVSSMPPEIKTGVRSSRALWHSLLSMSAAVLLALGNAASSSRTGLAQWVLVIGLAVLWGGAQSTALRRVLLAAAIGYGVATVALPWLVGLDPLTSGAWARLRAGDAPCAGRITLWSNVLHLIAQKPWVGWGWGELSYAHFTTVYPGARFCDILDNAHNLPLHLAVELGLPFSIAFCGAGLWIVIRSKPWRATDSTQQMAWTVLAVIGLHSLLEYPLWYGPFQMAVGLCVWMLWRRPDPARAGAESARLLRPLVPVWKAWPAIVLIAFCSFAGWDYWRVSQLYLLPIERASAYRDNTLNKLRGSWVFKSQVRFAELTTMQLTLDNAEYAFDLAQQLLHFSPEPRVVEKLIESAVMLGRVEDAAFYLLRYKAAFPEAHARWAAESTRDIAP